VCSSDLAVNLASRLEGLTKQYGVDILVGENTRHAVPEFLYHELDHVRVVGKDVPVALYEPLGLADELGSQVQAEVALFHEMRRCYRQCDWDGAESHLLELSQRSPHDKLYRIYLERVRHFRREPPPVGWDGVYVHQSK
jgi:adenylate cyclase